MVVIGSGIYTFVYKGREIETNELRAIKVIRLETLKNYIISANNGDPEIKLKEYKEYIDEYINECKIMKICSNINSVKYYEYFKNENEFVIIMELCDCNLLQFLMRSNKRFFIKEIYEIMKQLNNGLKIMRENKIIHKSLKLENILIKYEDNNKYIIKLTDYESNKRAKLLYNVKYQTYLEILKYRPPEILKEGKFNYKSNLWTIGIIFSNGNNFSNMFSFCKSLSDIKVLENWNVSNGINFSKMFSFCNSLSDIKGLENWDVSKGNNFSEMFSGCTSLLDIKGLQNWNVSNGINFSCMFCGCNSLLDINGLKNWNISNENKFYGMFIGCESLSNTNRSEYIDVLNGNNFSYKFCGCKSLLDIK